MKLMSIFSALAGDFHYAARALAKRPALTIVSAITLAIGIGANSAIFSAVNAALLRALPFRDAARLVSISETHPVLRHIATPYPDFVDWRTQAKSFEGLAAYTFEGQQKLNLVVEGEARQLQAALVSSNLLPLLGVTPSAGRGFAPQDDQPGHSHGAILSHGTWVRYFNADRGIVGRNISLDGESFEVVGVMPADQPYPVWADVLLPVSRLTDFERATRKYHLLDVVGRLKAGATLEQARTELTGISQRLASAYPATNRTIGSEVIPFREQFVGEARQPLLLLLVAVGFILLIACANVANLLLAHGAARRREMVVRVALGAQRSRLIRQLLAESLLLGLLGAIPGLLLATGGAPLLHALAPEALKLSPPSAVDLSVVAFTLAVAVLTAVGFGILPAMASSRISLTTFLTQRTSAAMAGSGRLRNILVGAEVALAVIVLIGAGLLVRSFSALMNVDAGFRPDHVLTMQISLSPTRYPDAASVVNFYRRLIPNITAVPGVETVATTSRLPLTAPAQTRFAIDGEPLPEAGRFPVAQMKSVSAQYFETLRIALKRGRTFTGQDENQNFCIINETLARRFYPHRDPVGRKLLLGVVDPHPVGVPILGVVADTRDSALALAAEPEIYFPAVSGVATLVVRTRGNPLVAAPLIRAQVTNSDRELPIGEVRSMDEVLGASLSRRRFSMQLLSGFSAIGLLLAAIGLYGVLSYVVTERTRELGLRIALGAQQSDIFALVLRQGMVATVGGLAVGILVALGISRWMVSLLYGVSGADPVTYLGVSALLLAVAVAAIYLPARRAVRIEPLEALRYE